MDTEGDQRYEEATKPLKLSWWQDALLKDYDTDIACVTAGYGSGKTLGSVLWIHERMAYNPGCDGIYIEPQYNLIKRVAIPAFREAFDMLGMVEGKHYRVFTSAENPRIVYNTGQIIYFISGERPESIVGITTACCAVIDEAGLVSEEVLQKTRARVRYKKARKCQILCTGTPEGLNWFSETFDNDSQPGWRMGMNNKDWFKDIITVAPNGKETHQVYRRFRATVYSNEHNLAPNYIANLLDTWRFNQNYIDSYIFGYFRPFATGLAYSNFQAARHKIPDIKPDPSKAIHLTWDYNISPAWVGIQRQIEHDFTGGAYRRSHYWAAIHNASGVADQLEEAVIEFARKFPRKRFRNTPIYVYGDPTGHAKSHKSKGSDFQNIISILKRLGFKKVELAAIKSSPLERTSVDFVQKELSENRFRICDRCDMVLKSITRTCWKDDERAKLDKPQGDCWTHPMDAVKYFFCALNGNSKKRVIGGRL